MAKKTTKKKTTPQAAEAPEPAKPEAAPAAAESAKPAKPKPSKQPQNPTSRIRFVKRHKGFMPGDETEQTGGVAKTLVQIGVAEFLTRKGVKCKPDGSPLK